ncbi:GNAT family N-acetyltransferase [Legionella pneumophila serogroup 1]|uniref:GNAT family N-acetyltransferase n=1 Tax=Legionella pneumophila TaxID=446 RepID=UPI00077B9CFB|nr:GNAT family N-acetyltransferase [Legionella pneumophila]
MFQIKFKQLSSHDVQVMHQWFNEPHVQEFYSLRSWSKDEVLHKLEPYLTGEKPVLGFIININNNPIGYIQTYKVMDFPWDNQDLPNEIINNSAGIDLFIGDAAFLGKGFGYKIIDQFLAENIWPEFNYCIVDPQINNIPAIRCYEKLGFKKHKVIETKDALNYDTNLMLMIKHKDKILA